MKKPAALIRVSSGEKQDTSRQREAIQRCADKLGISSSLIWFEDSEGRNPRDLADKRPGFQRLLAAVQAGLVDLIIVDSQDRFGTKDAYEWGAFIHILRKHNCRLIDATGRELSGDDELSILAGTLGAITSTKEQQEKGKRQIESMVSKGKRGRYLGGMPPYGLDVACFDAAGREVWRTVWTGRDKRLKVYPDGRKEKFDGKGNTPQKSLTEVLRYRPSRDKERLKIVRQIFKWYASDAAVSPKIIARWLNEMDADPVTSESWYGVIVAKILENPIYLGFPTFNKRAGSRFWEFVDGEFRPIKGNAKLGRLRDKSNWIQPDKAEFPAIVDAETWNTCQKKRESAKAEQAKRVKTMPQTDELWLRPFLYCGECGGAMHATRGWATQKTKGKRVASYFCGTYNRHGRKADDNPKGCYCHRIEHDRLAKVVLKYVKETSPKVASLLKATETGNLELARPLIEAMTDSAQARYNVFGDMFTLIFSEMDDADVSKELRKGQGLIDVYGVLYERLRPSLDKEIGKRESALDRMMEGYADLTGALRDRARQRMESLQVEINGLRDKTADLRKPWESLTAELRERENAIKQAQKVLSNGAAGRAKAEALRKVLGKVVCHFKQVERKPGKPGKSRLDRVEIVSATGESLDFSAETQPGLS